MKITSKKIKKRVEVVEIQHTLILSEKELKSLARGYNDSGVEAFSGLTEDEQVNMAHDLKSAIEGWK
jgi:hypothetical protein